MVINLKNDILFIGQFKSNIKMMAKTLNAVERIEEGTRIAKCA